MSAHDFDQVKRELAAELRSDVLRGRGQLPRDKSGRVSSSFLNAVAGDVQCERSERPQERSLRWPSDRPTHVGDVLQLVMPIEIPIEIAIDVAAAAGPRTSRVEQLERLERELAALLAPSAPTVWEQIRRPLWRLLKRARRQLRTVDHSHPVA